MFRDGRAQYAFNLIVRKHTPALYRHIRRMVLDADDTDDVLQNVFIKTERMRSMGLQKAMSKE